MTAPHPLLLLLSRRGVSSARELMQELGVSQATLSRAIASAGHDVCRMGRARATQYARTRSIPGLGSRLPVARVDAQGRVSNAGVLVLLDGGRHWLESESSATLFAGLPPWAVEMSPQGYLGRGFPVRFPELGLPPRVVDWSDDHRVTSLARRGEDCIGDRILGEESLNRYLSSRIQTVDRTDYPGLARDSAMGQAGSSAGGEQPKFLAFAQGRHVLVKFVGADAGAAGARWRDLLACEALALEAVRGAGLDAAGADCFVEQGFRYLEVERFDRIGPRGRRALLSLGVVDNEYLGVGGSWTRSGEALVQRGLLDAEDGRRIRWLDVFGNLIGNSDRHPGNLSLFEDEAGRLRLAPIYDMLPMQFAPSGTTVVERPFTPAPPTHATLDVWSDAAQHARRYWGGLIACDELSAGFRRIARACLDSLDTLIEQAPV